jgi:hypothetical protein
LITPFPARLPGFCCSAGPEETSNQRGSPDARNRFY